MLAFIALVWLVSTARSGSFSCRSCAILSFHQAESSDDYTFTSYCSYAKCDDSLSPGPLCITSFGQDYTCDGSIHPWGSSVDDSYYYACKCPGPLAMPSLQINLTQPNGTVTPNTQMPINASLVDAYKPMICPTAALDMPVCSSASATEACSVVRSGQYRCTLLGRPLNGTDAASSPHTRYGLFGDTKECDNTLQSNNSYICSCPSGPGNGIVDQSLANKTSPNGVIDESGGINPTKCGTALDSAGAGLLDVDKEGFVVMASYVGRYYNADGMDMSPIVDSGSQT